MTFHSYGQPGRPRLLLIHGLGVTHEIFLPLIGLLKGEYDITAVGIDGFLLDVEGNDPAAFTCQRAEEGCVLASSCRAVKADVSRLYMLFKKFMSQMNGAERAWHYSHSPMFHVEHYCLLRFSISLARAS